VLREGDYNRKKKKSKTKANQTLQLEWQKEIFHLPSFFYFAAFLFI